MAVDQVVVGASPGDAVTGMAQELQALLGGPDRSGLYARYIDPALQGEVRPLDAYADRPSAGAGDVLVLHVSIGQPDVAGLVRRRPERLVLVYHNISPSGPFRPYDPGLADTLDAGRAELAGWRDRAEATIALSPYSAGELVDAGWDEVEILPVIVDPERLAGIEPDAPTVHHLAGMEGPVVLSVGQVLPHKHPELVVEAFHILTTWTHPDASLILAGPTRLAPYARAVQRQVNELNLTGAWVTGAVPDAVLAAFYRRADVLVSASEHEGFGVPFLEAMAFDVPVVARRMAAVPDTVGAAALLVEPGDGPAVLSEAVAAALESPLGPRLAEAGRRRLAEFAPEPAREAWRDRLAALA